MSKRGASEQITRENHLEQESDDEPKSASQASASVLAKRKILKPRGRTPGSSLASSASPAPSFGSSVGSNGAFSSIAKSQETTKTGTQQKPFSFGGAAKVDASDDKNEKIKALNDKFVETLNKGHKQGHVANFTDAAKKYIEYYEKILKGEISLPDESSKAPESKTSGFSFGNITKPSEPSAENKASGFSFGNTTKPSEAPAFENKTSGFSFGNISKPVEKSASEVKPSFSFGKTEKPVETPSTSTTTQVEQEDSSSDSEEEIKIEGPKFTLSTKPTVKKTPFSFGPKPEKKANSDSDSDSEIEIKGPTFNFSKPIKDSVFKLDAPKPSESNATEGTEEKKEDSKPAFSFGSAASGKKEDPKPAFSFGTNTEKKEDPKPAFSFGASADKKDEPKPTFSFGATSSTEKKDEPKPAFSFGSAPSTEKKDEPKPAFSFGSTPSTEKKDDSKPAFSFGSSSTEKKDEPKPAFSFGATNNESKGLFSGSSTSDSTPKPFSFGSEKKDESLESNPKSSFQFSFNPQPQSQSDKPTFSFGSTNTGKPLFGNNDSATSFNFKAKDGEISNSATPDTQNETGPEEDTGGNFKAIAQLSSEKVNSQTGEEDEENLYAKRSKLMLFDPSNTENPYESKGLGDLKVLKNKSTGKSRILVRAEGGLRILLNTLVSKDMTYTTIGNGSMVRVPTVNPNDKSIETFVLKVKTADDGKKLLDVLNEAKS